MISFKPEAKSSIIYDVTKAIEEKYKLGELDNCTKKITEINEILKVGTDEVKGGAFTFFATTIAKRSTGHYDSIFLIFWDTIDKKTRSLTENQVRLWIREVFGIENADDEMESIFPFAFRKIGDTEKVHDEKFREIVLSLVLD